MTVRSSENSCAATDGSAVDGGCAPVASGDGGDVDEVQNGEGSSVASTESSSSSWNAEEKPLEEL
jgi:hypothetical protein